MHSHWVLTLFREVRVSQKPTSFSESRRDGSVGIQLGEHLEMSTPILVATSPTSYPLWMPLVAILSWTAGVSLSKITMGSKRDRFHTSQALHSSLGPEDVRAPTAELIKRVCARWRDQSSTGSLGHFGHSNSCRAVHEILAPGRLAT